VPNTRSPYREPFMTEVFDVTPADETVADEVGSANGIPTPVDYLVHVARSRQLVMLADRRGVTEHLRVLQDAVAPLHEAGITNLAWEFTNSRRQDDLDTITTAERWDRRAAIELFVDLLGIGHGYEDYLDVIHAVWNFNQDLAPDVAPFRLLGLGLATYVEDPDLLEGRSAGETSLRNWWMGGHYRDISASHMANIITAEIIRSGQRGVVYCDTSRTNTRFVEWIDDQVSLSPGNLLHNWMGDGVARLVFHGAIDDDEALVRIEQLVAASPDPETSFGLDLVSSTLGGIRLHGLHGSLGGADRSFDLEDIADGYLFVSARASWTRAKLIPDMLDPTTIEAAERRYRALDPRDTPYSLDELEEIRARGHDAMRDGWPEDPSVEEEPAGKKKGIFRRS